MFETPSLTTSLDVLTSCICSSSPDEVLTFPTESAGLSLDSMRPSPVSPVSCNNLDDYDLLEIWSELEEHLLFHGAVQFQLDKHVGVLGDFVVDFTEKGCDRFRYAYSQCWWCAPNITSDNNYCSFDALCASSHVEEKEEEQQEVVNADEENPILSTCNELDWWVGEEGRNKVSTKGLCQRAVAAMQQRCPQYCDPCFDEVHPPSCSGEGIVVDNSTDVLETCFDMWKLLHGGYQGNNSFGNDPFHLAKHMDLLSPIRASSPRCDAMRQSYHLCYWCSKSLAQASSYHECTKDICVYEGEPEKFDSAEHEGVSRGEMDSACDDIRHTLAQDRFPTTADLCEKAERFHRYCSCDEPNPVIEYTDYLGADSDVKKNALVWVSRVSAFLSFLGGFYILWDVFRSKSSISVYHELMVGIACFDLCTAFAWAFATAAIPADDGYSISGAEGNDATCKAQGYFIQLGFTSVLYNVSLAMYYLLVIIRSWRERKLRKIRLFLHGPLLLVGFGLAFGGLPFYAGFDYVCHLAPDLERGDNLWKVFVFTVVPIGFSMFCITATMLFIYLHVRKKTLAARRWRLGSGDLDNRVFWQALFYTLSFYITWKVVFLVYLTGIDTLKDKYGLSVLMAFVSPLQGFNNFLVYVRPKAKFHPPCLRSVTGTMSSIFMRIPMAVHSAHCATTTA